MDPLPPIQVPHPHVTSDPTVYNGSPTVVGSRVPVRRLWAWYRKGVTVETLIKRYPGLGPAKVLGALAFAHDNQDLMAADLAREAKLIAAEEIHYEPVQKKLPFDPASG